MSFVNCFAPVVGDCNSGWFDAVVDSEKTEVDSICFAPRFPTLLHDVDLWAQSLDEFLRPYSPETGVAK